MSIIIEISPEAAAVLRRVRQVPARIPLAIAGAMDLQNEYTIGAIVAKRLSFPRQGPPVSDGLRTVTGLLRRSVRRTKAKVSGSEVESSIGTNVRYAGVHEFGYEGTQNVRQHNRRVPRGDTFLIGGVQVTRRTAGQFGAFKGGRSKVPQTSSGFATVRGHSRRVKFTARAPIGRTLSERQSIYSKAVSEAILKSVGGGA